MISDNASFFEPDEILPRGFANRVMLGIQAEKLRQIELRSRQESFLWSILLVVIGFAAVALADRVGWLQVETLQAFLPLGLKQCFLLSLLAASVYLADVLFDKYLPRGSAYPW